MGRAYNRLAYAAEENPQNRDNIKRLETMCLGTMARALTDIEACADQCQDNCEYPERDKIDRALGIDDGRE